ncbi:MAG: hypothetical protein ACYSTJ_03800 [Planctomycetota bacterium]|jgi:hypothetical protein
MSPNGQISGRKTVAPSNLYTIILALALFAVIAAAGFVAYKCYFQYGTIIKIP